MDEETQDAITVVGLIAALIYIYKAVFPSKEV